MIRTNIKIPRSEGRRGVGWDFSSLTGGPVERLSVRTESDLTDRRESFLD